MLVAAPERRSRVGTIASRVGVFLLAFVAACGGATRSRSTSASCITPLAFGAVVDDGQDDREALQAALDLAGETGAPMCLPVGTLHVSRRTGAIASLVMPARGVLVHGQGTSSRLAMLPQHEDVRHDWWLIQISGTHHVLRDFAIDGTTRGITGEQTHLLQIRGPASHIRLERLTLYLPVQPGNSGGDCIRMLGEAGKAVEQIAIVEVRGVECARSFIAFQRHVAHVTVDRAHTEAVGGQAIDMEPTGDGAIEDVVIRRSRLTRGAIARGGYTVTLAGSPRRLSQRLVLEDSEIEAGVQVYRVHGASIRRNRITGGFPGRGLVKVMQDSQRVVIEDNELLRSNSNGDGIEFSIHHGRWPRHAKVRDNVIRMEREGYPIHGEPVEHLDVIANRIICYPGSRAAIYLRGVGASIDGGHIHGNQISGGCRVAVRIAQHGNHLTGRMMIENNTADGVGIGVEFENAPPRDRPVIRGNNFHLSPSKEVVGGAP